MTDLEYFIKKIDKYRDDLADRRGRRERYEFVELNDKGYINAITEVILDLYYVLEDIKKKIEIENS